MSLRAYLIALIILAVLALLMALPDAAITIAFLTLGLGLPVVFSATLLLYGLCLGPSVVCWSGGTAARTIGTVASAALVTLVALAPDFVGRREAYGAAAARLASDHIPKEPVRASTLEIRRPAQSYDDTFADQKACGTECRSLLAGGQVQWVRVIEFMHASEHTPPVSSFHRALHGKDCAVPGGKPDDSAVCVVDMPDPGDAAELVIDFTIPNAAEAVRLSRFASLMSRRVVVAQTQTAGQASEVLRETEVTVQTPYRPTLLAPTFNDMHSGGTDIALRSYEINALTLAGILTRLGYSSSMATGASAGPASQPDWRAPIDDNMTREMIAVLDMPGNAPFNDEQMATVFNWIEHARNVEVWTPDQLELLRRFVRDRRVRRPTFFDQIFARRPEVAKALLPDVLDTIEADGITADYTPARQAAYKFVDVDEVVLRPYADRIIALLGKSPNIRAILLPVVGRIGVDPLPWVTPILADRVKPSPYSFDPRTIAACRADPQWAKELIPALREAYRDPNGVYGRDAPYRELLLKALTNLGDREFVESELASGHRIDPDRLRQEIAFAEAKQNPAEWLCRQ